MDMTELSPLRKGRITASRVAGILGYSPYNDRASVLRDMVRQHFGLPSEFQGNIATRHGQACEPLALALYESRMGHMTYGAELVLHPAYDFLAATPDGLVGEAGMVEVKSPYRAIYTHASDRMDYVAQMQLQMACADREWCDFVIYRDEAITVERVHRDPLWLVRHLPALEHFMRDYNDAIAAGGGLHVEPLIVRRSDDAWQLAAQEWSAARKSLDLAGEAEKAARDALINLAAERSSSGYGVSLSRSVRRGAVDYRAIPELSEVDLDSYRKAATVVWSIREIKDD